MRTHVADGDGLTSGARSGRCSRGHRLSRADSAGEAVADRLSGVQLASRERSGTGDERSRTPIIRDLSLEDVEYSLGTNRGPVGE